MSIEKVKDYFARYGLQDRVQEFPVSSATVELAAQALQCEPCRIAKTLSFLVGETPVLIVAAGDAKIDNPKYKAQFGTKAKCSRPSRRRRSSAMRWAASARLPSTPVWRSTSTYRCAGSKRCSPPAAAPTAPSS